MLRMGMTNCPLSLMTTQDTWSSVFTARAATQQSLRLLWSTAKACNSGTLILSRYRSFKLSSFLCTIRSCPYKKTEA
uniref:Uncharacterized protein n=1 Tax=Parascaris equorum TaxID=6256 RepID=A0A914RK88_PAREQ